jgi:hypothetical protein
MLFIRLLTLTLLPMFARFPALGRFATLARFPALRRLSQVGVLAIPGRALLPGATAERLAPNFCGDEDRNAVFPGERGAL